MSAHRNQELELLKRILDQEIESYGQVEQKMAEKNQVLIRGNASELSRLDRELIALNQRTIELEKQRISLMMNMGKQNYSLQEFINSLDIHKAAPLIEARQRLNRVIGNVRDLNSQNKRLLEISLKWIETSVETIAQMLTPQGASYDGKGDKSHRKSATNLGQSTINHSA